MDSNHECDDNVYRVPRLRSGNEKDENGARHFYAVEQVQMHLRPL
jgi:hypothetical protein